MTAETRPVPISFDADRLIPEPRHDAEGAYYAFPDGRSGPAAGRPAGPATDRPARATTARRPARRPVRHSLRRRLD